MRPFVLQKANTRKSILKYNAMKQVLFVGDAALGVPKSRIYSPFWADEGVRPYRLIFPNNNIESRSHKTTVDNIRPKCYNMYIYVTFTERGQYLWQRIKSSSLR